VLFNTIVTSRPTASHHCLTLSPTWHPEHSPGRSPDSPTRQPTGKPAARQPGNPAAPGSTRQHLEVPPHCLSLAAPGSTRQHPAAPGSRPGSRPGKPGTRQTRQPGKDLATPRQPGNPATRPGNTRQPGNQGSNHGGAIVVASSSGSNEAARIHFWKGHPSFSWWPARTSALRAWAGRNPRPISTRPGATPSGIGQLV